MVDRQLVHYVKEQLKKGYSASAIQSVLSRSGYSPTQTAAAIKAAKHHFPVAAIGIIAAVVAVLGVGLYLIFSSSTTLSSPAHFTITVQPDTTTLHPGDLFGFLLTIGGNPSQSGGRARYTITDSTGSSIVSKEETISFSSSQRDSLTLPHTLPEGTYTLTAQILTSDKTTQATATFLVSGDRPSVRIIEERAAGPLVPPESDIAEIVQLAKQQPNQALGLCMEFSDKTLADNCLLDAGLTTHNSNFCSPITNGDKRDTCYFNLVLITHEGMLCRDITNSNLRSTCSKI